MFFCQKLNNCSKLVVMLLTAGICRTRRRRRLLQKRDRDSGQPAALDIDGSGHRRDLLRRRSAGAL
jgi:hypothetical protein